MDGGGAPNGTERVEPFARYLGYVYLLRVPLLVWVFLVAFPWLAVANGSAASAVLRGIFDIGSPSWTASIFAYFLVTLASLLAGLSVSVTAQIILLDGHRRFGTRPVRNSPRLRRLLGLPALVVAPLSIVSAVWFEARVCESPVTFPWEALGTLAGVAAFGGRHALWRERIRFALVEGARPPRAPGAWRPPAALRWLGPLVAWFERGFDWLIGLSPPGYHDAADARRRYRHRFAATRFLVSLFFYVALLVMRGLAPHLVRAVPTLCLILVLVTLLCWGMSALTFFLDRFRIPLLVTLAGYVWLVGLWPGNDHFYRAPTQPPYPPPSPREILSTRLGAPVILVAASGGGIQAEAWTARVLSGLRQDLGPRFDRSLALVSCVSGGSVGAMHFVASYQGGKLAEVSDLEAYPPVVDALQSSLDDVTWGIVYPDFVFSFVPFLEGMAGGVDRGTMLERAWELGEGVKRGTLRGWQEEARAGLRPAVIFNATLVETGDRLMLSTTTLGPSANVPGRREFSQIYPDRDLAVATAARLSASFPYVSPAARAATDGRLTPAYHAVDGGYYDNFGVSSLVEWLDTALLADGPKPPAVFIVEIRAFKSDAESPDRQPKQERGGVFQTLAPLDTLMAVRDTAQLARNEFALSFISRPHVYDVPIRVFTFEYVGGCGADPENTDHVPLSWHLTPKEKRELREEWGCGPIRKVRDDLTAAFGP